MGFERTSGPDAPPDWMSTVTVRLRQDEWQALKDWLDATGYSHRLPGEDLGSWQARTAPISYQYAQIVEAAGLGPDDEEERHLAAEVSARHAAYHGELVDDRPPSATRCHECGESLKPDDDLAEVYVNAEKLRAEAGGQWVLVDDIPDSAFGPFIVHQDPCFTGTSVNQSGLPKYELA